MHDEEGLLIQQHGASRDVINSARSLGFSTIPVFFLVIIFYLGQIEAFGQIMLTFFRSFW